VPFVHPGEAAPRGKKEGAVPLDYDALFFGKIPKNLKNQLVS
jgi:hypothetical protein